MRTIGSLGAELRLDGELRLLGGSDGRQDATSARTAQRRSMPHVTLFAAMNDFQRFRGTDRYLTSSGLEAAVNCALALERPLLVRGEPGTGKTLLAEAIAEGLGLQLIHWPVKSTTRAQDGLYVYDTVQRLYDSRFGDGDVKDIRRYIQLGPLGEAFAAPARVVLLIDEVDKADLEFPNDLLHELDRMRFFVSETGDEIVAKRAAGRDHHVERREGAARRVPAPLRVPLHRVPRSRADDAHRARAPSDARDEAARAGAVVVLRAARRRTGCASGRRRRS